ncbi:MAG: hypothetical protein JNL82_25600 [Myxococcales bacterium]|nr:hypothetical protein [Myxococcales bacterium]
MRRALRWLGRAIINHGGTKFTALVLALVFFIVTRDDITRTFTIPLHIVNDPNRVLLTKLPDTVSVELHGSWARMSRLHAQELGMAELNLADARPGPLAVDPATIVMPEGVIFRAIHYEKVDLRFDRVIERAVPISAEVSGVVDPDFEHTGTVVDPPRWRMRGGSGVVAEVANLVTDPIDLDGLTADRTIVAALQRPRQAVEFTAVAAGEVPQVKVTVTVRPKIDERRLTAAVIAPDGETLPPEVPTEISVVVRGNLPDLRVLDRATSPPLVAIARREKPTPTNLGGSVAFTVRFTDAVPMSVQGHLALEAAIDRVALPEPPPTPGPRDGR